MIVARINVNNIEKHRLYKGEKGVYLNMVFIETPNNQYNDYMIVQEVPKEERKAGNQGVILGNARILAKKVGAGEGEIITEEEQDNLPF